MNKDSLVQHVNTRSVLARVVDNDPKQKDNVIIECLSNKRTFSCPKAQLEGLGG